MKLRRTDSVVGARTQEEFAHPVDLLDRSASQYLNGFGPAGRILARDAGWLGWDRCDNLIGLFTTHGLVHSPTLQLDGVHV